MAHGLSRCSVQRSTGRLLLHSVLGLLAISVLLSPVAEAAPTTDQTALQVLQNEWWALADAAEQLAAEGRSSVSLVADPVPSLRSAARELLAIATPEQARRTLYELTVSSIAVTAPDPSCYRRVERALRDALVVIIPPDAPGSEQTLQRVHQIGTLSLSGAQIRELLGPRADRDREAIVLRLSQLEDLAEAGNDELLALIPQLIMATEAPWAASVELAEQLAASLRGHAGERSQ